MVNAWTNTAGMFGKTDKIGLAFLAVLVAMIPLSVLDPTSFAALAFLFVAAAQAIIMRYKGKGTHKRKLGNIFSLAMAILFATGVTAVLMGESLTALSEFALMTVYAYVTVAFASAAFHAFYPNKPLAPQAV